MNQSFSLYSDSEAAGDFISEDAFVVFVLSHTEENECRELLEVDNLRNDPGRGAKFQEIRDILDASSHPGAKRAAGCLARLEDNTCNPNEDTVYVVLHARDNDNTEVIAIDLNSTIQKEKRYYPEEYENAKEDDDYNSFLRREAISIGAEYCSVYDDEVLASIVALGAREAPSVIRLSDLDVYKFKE